MKSAILSLCILIECCNPTLARQSDSTRPFVLGVIQTLHSRILGEDRILNIYLPDGYQAGDTTHYPVVYLLDGSADEDFIHVVGLYQFNSFPWINRVPKSIVVGIANVDRKRDFSYPTTITDDKKKFPTTGQSSKFMDLLEQELQPFIQSKYRCNSSRTIIGESLGGLFATEVLVKRPSLFNKYIIISPSLWWDNGSLLRFDSMALIQIRNQTRVYIGVGKEGLTPGNFPRVMEVDANQLADKLQSLKIKNLSIYFDYLPAENHASISHQSIFNALNWLYKNAETH